MKPMELRNVIRRSNLFLIKLVSGEIIKVDKRSNIQSFNYHSNTCWVTMRRGMGWHRSECIKTGTHVVIGLGRSYRWIHWKDIEIIQVIM